MKLSDGGPYLGELFVSEVVPLSVRPEKEAKIFDRGEVFLCV